MTDFKDLLQVKNETETTADLYFYGEICRDWWGAWDDEDQYPAAVRDFLRENAGKDLNIYINSDGGSVFAGIVIYNMLRRHQGKKTVYVDGLAASIASVIALAGDRVVVPANAFLMIHKPWAIAEGNADAMRKMAEDLDAVETGILNVYRDHLAEGATMEDVTRMVQEETWLNGEEAAKVFRIEVAEAKEYPASVTDACKAYRKVPKEIIRTAQAADDKNARQKKVDNIKRLVLQATI